MGYRLVKVEESKKSGLFSKRVLVFMLLFLLCFTATNMALFYITGNEPSTLITCVFGFCGAEGGYMAFIKRMDIKANTKEIEVGEDEHTNL